MAQGVLLWSPGAGLLLAPRAEAAQPVFLKLSRKELLQPSRPRAGLTPALGPAGPAASRPGRSVAGKPQTSHLASLHLSFLDGVTEVIIVCEGAAESLKSGSARTHLEQLLTPSLLFRYCVFNQSQVCSTPGWSTSTFQQRLLALCLSGTCW